jgi:Spy/CpxP family protein refolding chaperone
MQRPAGGAGGGFAGGRLGGGIQRFQAAMADLNLTDDQKPKVDAALADAKKAFADVAPQLQQGGPPSPEAREKIRTAMEDLRNKLMAILNPDQQEKLKAALQRGGPGGQGGPGGFGGGRRGPGAGGGAGAEKPAGNGDYPKTGPGKL